MNTSAPYLVSGDENSKINTLELPHNIEAEQQLLGALIEIMTLLKNAIIQD